MYKISYTNRFKKSLKRCVKRGLNIDKLRDALLILEKKGVLPEKYKAHKLSGNYNGAWECHIEPDWLMIWEQNNMELTLLFIDTGSHSDLFD